MADQRNPDTTVQDEDERFRQDMQRSAAHDPEAKRWTELDGSARSQEQRIDRLARDLDGRGQSLADAETGLNEARIERYEWLAANERPQLFDLKGRKAWDQELAQYDRLVNERRQDFMDAAEKAEPSEIAAVQQRIREQQEELHQTLQERQGIAKLPSEEGQEGAVQRQGLAQVLRTPPHDQARQARFQNAGQGEPSPGNWAGMADTIDSREHDRRLEQTQRDYELQHGHRGNDAQIRAFEAARAEQPSQDSDGSMRELLARRRKSQAQGQ